MKMTKALQKILSLLLCMALIAGYVPLTATAVGAESRAAVVGAVADPGTAESWENMMGTDADGNRYAGRVWVDKSVYVDGDEATLNTRGEAGSSFQVELAEDEAFQIVFSALGSTMTTKRTVSSNGPMDVVLVLDDSTSMDDIISGGTTRLEKLVDASNNLLADLLTATDIRIGIVAYNTNSMTVLPFGRYENGIELRVRNNKFIFDEYNPTDKGGTLQAFDKDGKLLYNNTQGFSRGTNLQAGFDAGMRMLENATDVKNRTPVAIVLTDGAANTAVQGPFYDVESQSPRVFSGNTAPISVALGTLLTAAYRKARVEAVYGISPVVYGVGVDIAGNATANAIINPGAAENGFNNKNSSANVTTAYQLYNNWLLGNTIRRNENYNGTHQFVFDHSYKSVSNITQKDIENNIYYVDTYYSASSAELNEAFKQIFEELTFGVFNPISTSTSVEGGTGVDDTPLIYVDFIGQHMQIKEIQAVTLFGHSYGVIKNADGSYKVDEATGINPTTNEEWNTAEDILINVIRQEDGTQKLEIRINQQILPIIMEQVVSKKIGGFTEATITELEQPPLRVYYTVGVDSQVLLPGGEVDISKLRNYPHIDDATGTVCFYSNRFGIMNDGVANGDAHVGFKPSDANRYYYHQANQGIFTKVTDKSGNEVTVDENDQYGIPWDEKKYDLTWMSYDEYLAAKDTDKVYTYVSYCRPTPDANDAENAAEEVTYLVYTEWKYLKESVAFYDAASGSYLNDGKAIDESRVETTVAAYLRSNPDAELYAVLGVGSLRTSRLHNMTVAKTQNATGTAINRYAPEYTYETADLHSGNDVVVWLGNNGKLTLKLDTGIALTKTVTEPIGKADDTYALTVTVPQGVIADPVAVDTHGKTVASTYENNVLTVDVKAGQTVYIKGIPGGTQCLIGEIVNGDYYIESKTDQVRVPLISEVRNGAPQFVSADVTNAPNKYADLYITKEITSDHSVPQSVLDTIFEIKVNLGAALAGQFVTVANSEFPNMLYGEIVDADGNVTLQIKARQTIKLLRLPQGMAVTVTETDPGSHFQVSYRTRNHSGEAADNDNRVTIPANGSATAVVLNHYIPSPVSVDLDLVIDKSFADESVASHLEGGTFTFKAQKFNAAEHLWTDLATDTIRYEAGQFGHKSVTIADVLNNEIYSEVGTYSYRVFEEKGNVTNISYDRTIYTFDVIVTDNGGQLEAKVVDLHNVELKNQTGDGALDYVTSFTNTYETAPVSMDIVKVVDNKSGDNTVSAAGFKFKSVTVDKNGNPLDPDVAETPVNTVFSDAAGEARISGVYTKEQIGTHYYIVSEANDGKAGWTYSQAQYFVTVVVAEKENAGIFATITIEPYNEAAKKEQAPTVTDNNQGLLYFTNTYDPQDVTVDLDGTVSKELTGMPLEEGQFTFYVYADGDHGTPILTGTNNLEGDVHFVDFHKELTFDKEGKYQYDVLEHIPTGAVYDELTGRYVFHGMSYDPTVYDLVIEVTNDSNTGKLVASSYFEDAVSNTVTFYNSYKATPTEYVLGGRKILRGRAPKNGEFTFELYEADTLQQTTTNIADGSFQFQSITYTEAGTYTYTIKEVAGSIPGIRYEGVDNPVTVKVTVVDNNGALNASASISNADIKFENTYTAKPAQVTFNGTKTLVGGELEDNSFTFSLYSTDHSFDVTNENAERLATAQNVDGEFRFARTFSTTGSYYFVILEEVAETTDVVYDRTHHKFALRVSDNGDGQLKATLTNVTTGVSTGAAPSVTGDVAFTNARLEEVVRKEVYLAGDTTTKIDGQQVNAGDILTYFITYTNYTGEDVAVIIMDAIPKFTSYVEGSASHNGGCTGSYVNWLFNLSSGRTRTVSFSVRVDETEVVIANTAVVRDSVNTYTTNEVVNHTVENVMVKDVFSSKEPTVSIDGQKVSEGQELLYQISFTNASTDVRDVQISDVIPEKTTYVEGSADTGGVYENGKLLWNVEAMPAWSTVTVSFKVTVNRGIGAVTIDNQATATDGVNRYETNQVTNHTEQKPVEPDVPKPTDPPVPEIPKTDDNLNLQLWFTILFISCGALIAVLNFGKKKLET